MDIPVTSKAVSSFLHIFLRLSSINFFPQDNEFLLFQAYELERLEQQITVSLQGMGLSLVNSDWAIEIAYIAITPFVFFFVLVQILIKKYLFSQKN